MLNRENIISHTRIGRYRKLKEVMSESKVSMKLLIHTKGKRVLFAEAGKECVDFLFHLLSLPVATIITLLKAQGMEMEGSLPNLYNSLETLNDTYIQPNQKKDSYLKPLMPVSGSSVPLLPLTDAHAPNQKIFYKCSHCSNYVTDGQFATCPNCHRQMNSNVTYVAPPAVHVASEGGGLVKGVVTYMVMDDLVIKPMSTISSLTLLNKFNVKEVGDLEEKVVDLGMNEAVKLLKASLQSKKVLTDVFFVMGMERDSQGLEEEIVAVVRTEEELGSEQKGEQLPIPR